MKFIRKLQKQGTSFVVPIPKEIRVRGNLIVGTDVTLEYIKGKIIITPHPNHHVVECYKCNGSGIRTIKKKY